jgi:hypothetical protein
MEAVMNRSFKMAPMSKLFAVLSLALAAIPVFIVAAGFYEGQAVLAAIGGAVAFLYLFIHLWLRPGRFDLDRGHLTLCFPLRTRKIAWREVTGIRLIENGRALKDEFGLLMRVGAGGFLGTFGILWGKKKGSLDVYTSLANGTWVLVERNQNRPLLISPSDPEGFVQAAEVMRNK